MFCLNSHIRFLFNVKRAKKKTHGHLFRMEFQRCKFKKVENSSADMPFIVDLWRFPYNIHTAMCVTNWSNVGLFCLGFFKLNGYIYLGIHLQNLKLGVLKTMPKRQQTQELRGGIIVRNLFFFFEVGRSSALIKVFTMCCFQPKSPNHSHPTSNISG